MKIVIGIGIQDRLCESNARRWLKLMFISYSCYIGYDEDGQ